MSGDLSTWSLWLEPVDKIDLQRIIQSLAGISPPSAIFLPHVTLYSSIDISNIGIVRSAVERLVRDRRTTGPLHLQLLPPSTGSTFFQSILAPIKATDDLTALRKGCEEVWGERHFFPHLSLKYGDIDDERRAEIAEMARKAAVPDSIVVQGVSIVRCVGNADEWEVVERVLL